MATSSKKDKILKFVRADDSKEENLRRAANAASKSELDVLWVHARDVVGSINLDNGCSVFILDPFEGEHFEYLKSQKCRICGPQCVLSCLDLRCSLPNSSNPIYTVSMLGVFACCSSIDKQERQRLHDQIHLMGGVVLRDFTEAVTHLIAGEVGSKKYAVACSLGKAIMLPQWVYSVWEESKIKHVISTDKQFDKFRCPIFKGCTICVTGLDGQTRQDIKRQCGKNGGTYSGELNMNTCTHLLVNMPKGEKYDFARKWNIHYVSTQWFYDCIKTGSWLDESGYRTLPEEESSLSQPGSRLNLSATTSTSVISTKSRNSGSSSKAAQAAYQSAQAYGSGGLITAGSKKRRVINNSTTYPTKESTNASTLSGLDLDFIIQTGTMFLDGCKVFLSGFTGATLDKFRKVINVGGGTRLNTISEIVSHVVIGSLVTQDVEILKKSDFHPYVVAPDWIIDSAQNGKRMPEEDYLHPDFKIESDHSLPSSKENTKPYNDNQGHASSNGKDTMNANQSHNPDQQKPHKTVDADGLNDDEVFLQYGTQDQQLVTKELADEEEEDEDDTTFDDTKHGEVGLLSRKCFRIEQFMEDQVEHLKLLIEEHGGKVTSSNDKLFADFAILPMNAQCNPNLAKELVTFCWLEQCLQDGELFDLEHSFLFQPFIVSQDASPLNGCVLTVSQYVGVERDHLMQLAEILGANCQEHFVHKANRRFLANTHLLCREPEGSKYLAALKWSIPVISREWLFACARSGSLLPVVDFSVTPKPFQEHSVLTSSCQDKETISNNQESSLQRNEQILIEDLNSIESHRSDNCLSNAREVAQPMVHYPTDVERFPNGFHKQPFRPSFDVADVMEALESPQVPSLRSRKSRGSRNSFQLDDYFQEKMQLAIKRTGTRGGSACLLSVMMSDEAKRVELQVDEDKDEKTEDHVEEINILDGVILSVSKKLNQQQTELYGIASSLGADYRWLYDHTCTHLVHQGRANDSTKEYTSAKERGIYIVSPHWLHACAQASSRADENLYPHTYNPKMSLQGVTKGRRLTRSSKIALEDSIQEDSNKNEHKTQTRTNSEEGKAATGDYSNHFSDESKESGTNSKETPQNSKPDSEMSDPKEDLQKQIENFISVTKGVRCRRRSRRLNSCSGSGSMSHTPTGQSCEGDNDSHTGNRHASLRLRTRKHDQRELDKSSNVENVQKHSDEGERSQSDTVITYDDPAGRLERDKIVARLKRGSSPSPEPEGFPDMNDAEKGDDDDDDDEEEQKKENNESRRKSNNNNVRSSLEEQLARVGAVDYQDQDLSQSTPTPDHPPFALQVKEVHKPTPQNLLEDKEESHSEHRRREDFKFQLSAMTPQEKMDYSALIEQLGGKVFETQYFKTDCSHVVVGKPNRNEKYLAAMAAGKWVLRKSFLEDSRQSGYFVDEEPHEWGVEIPGEPTNKLALAARRWRLKLEQERKNSVDQPVGAFCGWRVLLSVDKVRQPGFKRLLEAGGAQVAGSRPPFNNIENVSHAFIDSNKMKTGTVDFETLYAAGIWLVKPDYIAEFLMQDPEPHPGRFLIPEALKLAQEHDKSNTSSQRKRKGDEMITDEKRARVE